MTEIACNQDLCIQCGICAEVCPARVLDMGNNGPVLTNPQACIACGHCVAVCSVAALDNKKTPLANQVDIPKFPVLDETAARMFLRSRRSVRCYKNAIVPREELLKLVNMARFAPTASNRQGVSYYITENKEVLKTVTRLTIEWMEEKLCNGSSHWSFPHHVRAYREKGIDTVLRDAPHLILATSDKQFGKGRENTIFSLAYLELFAPSLGLGSCWAGLLEMCIFEKYPPLLEVLKIPQDQEITGAVMVGYPKYQFKRLVDRDSLQVNWL